MLEVLALRVALQSRVARLVEPGRKEDAPVRSCEGVVLPLGQVVIVIEPFIHLRQGSREQAEATSSTSAVAG